MDFDWPSRSDFKKWLGYSELPYSSGNPRRVFDKISEELEDLGYSIEEEPFELEKTGDWEDIAELDASIYAVREDSEKRPLLPFGKEILAYAFHVLAVGLLLLAVGFLGNVQILDWIGFILLIIGVLLWWKKPHLLSREIVVTLQGDVRKALRSRRMKASVDEGSGVHGRSIEEAFISSDVQIRVGGQASEDSMEQKVREDVKTLISKIKHDVR